MNVNLTYWAITHETSEEIAEAIHYLAKNEKHAEAIWRDPTDEELIAVWERATKNGLINDKELLWGDSSLHVLRLLADPGSIPHYAETSFSGVEQ